MHVADILAVLAAGAGFWRGRKGGLGAEVYRFVRMGLPVIAGCGLFGLMRGLVGHLPFLSNEGAGIWGFVIGTGAVFALTSMTRKALRGYLERKFEDGSKAMAGVLGLVRGTLLVSVLVGAVELSPVRALTHNSVLGRTVRALAGEKAEEPSPAPDSETPVDK